MEMARILASGGFISPEDENGAACCPGAQLVGQIWWPGPCRVYQTSDLSEGGLTLGRAIGDFSLEKVIESLCCQSLLAADCYAAGWGDL